MCKIWVYIILSYSFDTTFSFFLFCSCTSEPTRSQEQVLRSFFFCLNNFVCFITRRIIRRAIRMNDEHAAILIYSIINGFSLRAMRRIQFATVEKKNYQNACSQLFYILQAHCIFSWVSFLVVVAPPLLLPDACFCLHVCFGSQWARRRVNKER